jgi:cardiolipin synthase
VTDGGPTRRCPNAAQGLLLEIAHRASLDLAHLSGCRLVHSGDEHFELLLEAISGAQRELCIEMYQIRPDPIGWRMCTALAEAALRGVKVRLLLDCFGSSRVGGWLEGLSSHGIEIAWYRPWRPWRNPFRRTHRKLIVIDGHRASIGGINLAAEFSERHSGSGTWRDVALWLEGGVAWQMRRQFEAAWRVHGGQDSTPMPVPSGSGTLCAVAGPTVGDSPHAAAYIAMADVARHELLFATPYFMPAASFRAALEAAARRGVRVVVALPRRNDIWWFKHGARRYYRRLLNAGVTIVERCDRMQHAKVAVVDGMLGAVGSTNLNSLSFHSNSETLLLTTDVTVAAELRSLIVDESTGAGEVLQRDGWSSHPDRQRWAELVSAPMSLIF